MNRFRQKLVDLNLPVPTFKDAGVPLRATREGCQPQVDRQAIVDEAGLAREEGPAGATTIATGANADVGAGPSGAGGHPPGQPGGGAGSAARAAVDAPPNGGGAGTTGAADSERTVTVQPESLGVGGTAGQRRPGTVTGLADAGKGPTCGSSPPRTPPLQGKAINHCTRGCIPAPSCTTHYHPRACCTCRIHEMRSCKCGGVLPRTIIRLHAAHAESTRRGSASAGECSPALSSVCMLHMQNPRAAVLQVRGSAPPHYNLALLIQP